MSRQSWLRGAGQLSGLAALVVALNYVLTNESGSVEQYFCISLALALALAIAVASGRPGLGMVLAGGTIGAMSLAAKIKLMYLHVPLMAPDLRYFLNLDTLAVLTKYPPLLRKVVAALLVAAMGIFVLWRLESPGLWRGRRRWWFPASAVATLPLLLFLWPAGPFHGVYAADTWRFLSEGKQNPVTGFVRSFSRMQVRLPTWQPGSADRFDWHADPPGGPHVRPDIVAVLEESTLDPRDWTACNLPLCHVGMFDIEPRTAASGLLKVHTYGGATWTSEFAFLTGLPTPLFGPAGVYAPYNLAPRMRASLPRLLKSRGYRTIAVYPMPHDFVNAQTAYAHYGFDAFHDANELGLKWESTDLDLEKAFTEIYREERAASDQPLFFMVLTMHQHGPHDRPLDELPPPFDTPLFPGLDATSNRNLGHYLFRLQQSDAAIRAIEATVLDGDRPAVLVHFGDHRPSFDGVEMSLAKRGNDPALTYYMLKSNRPDSPRHDYEVLDLANLAGLVLDVAGVPKDAYFTANAQLREHCRGLFMQCPDTAVLESYYAHVFGRLGVFGD